VIEAAEAEVDEIPGSHQTLLTEHLTELAEQLKSCLRKVDP
jgi:hypothetical protein